ncbi:hypothetical protein OPV22_006451 [Ensete ventricosum]|uniref:G protein gamma domain-containing protein n=1 Tax=Ensete ventricosum TaxID=4639 RepID=A0AAV8RR94_ENSVE|nr:hypothetical protein OPV22_006451 [Ensete ventricosum]
MEQPVPRAPQPAAAVVVAPRPKSPPKYPDLCGSRRLQLELHVLNREIGFIEEEMQSLEGIQPVSRCCKEVKEFVEMKPDPLMPINKRRHKSCCLWRWLRYSLNSVICQSYASTSHGFAASAGTSSGLKDQTALVHKTVAVATMGGPALSAARVLPVDHAAVVQGFLAVAPISAKHAAAAQEFLAVVEKHAAATQKSRAAAAKHAAVAQARLAADLSAVAGMLPPAVLAAASGGLPASNHGVISHHAPFHVAANDCAVAGGLLPVLDNGAMAAVDHNGAVPEDLQAVSEIGAVV